MFAAIACSNGWDDVTAAALQLLSHLDGDALNVALLIPESQRVVSGVLMKSLSEHYGSPGRLAEYKRQQKGSQKPLADYNTYNVLDQLLEVQEMDLDEDPSQNKPTCSTRK